MGPDTPRWLGARKKAWVRLEARLAFPAVVVAAILLMSPRPSPARPECADTTSSARTTFAATCRSGPGTHFAVTIVCTGDIRTRHGPARTYASGLYSAVGCPGRATIVRQGVEMG